MTGCLETTKNLILPLLSACLHLKNKNISDVKKTCIKIDRFADSQRKLPIRKPNLSLELFCRKRSYKAVDLLLV